DRGVAVPAIDAKDTNVMLVTERHRLDAGDARAGAVRGADEDQTDPQDGGHAQQSTEQTESGDRVGEGGEYPGHRHLLLAIELQQSRRQGRPSTAGSLSRLLVMRGVQEWATRSGPFAPHRPDVPSDQVTAPRLLGDDQGLAAGGQQVDSD